MDPALEIATFRLVERLVEAVERIADVLEKTGAPTPTYGGDDIDMSDLAKEAENLIMQVATPEVKRSVEINHDEKRPPKTYAPINLFNQARKSIDSLLRLGPNDKILNSFLSAMLKKYNTNTSYDLEDRVHLTAIEICYTHLPSEQWSTDVATQQIENLIQWHDGSEK